MGLLRNFISGAAGALPGVINGIEGRQRDEERTRREQELRDEQRREKLSDYERQQQGILAAEQRRIDYDQAQRQESARRGLLARGGDPSMIDAVASGAGPEVSDESGGHTAPGAERYKELARTYNKLLAAGPGGTMAVLKDEEAKDERDRIEGMSEADLIEKARRDALAKGVTPEAAQMKRDLEQARIDALEALSRQREAAAGKSERWAPSSGGGGGRSPADEVKAATIIGVYEKRAARAAKESSDAAEAVSKAYGATKKAEARAALDAARAREAAADAQLEEVIATGRAPSKAAAAQKPAAAGGPAVGTVINGYRFKGGNPNDKANWELVSAKPTAKKTDW